MNRERTKRFEIPRSELKVLSGDLNIRKSGKKAVVEIGGHKFVVRGVSCGLPGCMCDATIDVK
jgi:hypothetical protein